MNPMLKSKMALAIRLAISVLTLWLIAHSIEWQAVTSIFQRLQPGWVIVALLIFWVAQIVSALRCAYLARALGSELPLSQSVRAHFLGLWFNQVLPTSLGGDVVKLAVLTPRVGASIALRACILDRLSGLIFLMAGIFMTLPFYYLLPMEASMLVGLTLFSTSFLIALVFCAWGATHLRIRYQNKPSIMKLTRLFSDIWFLSKPTYLVQQVWTSAIVHFNGIAAYALLGVAMNIPVNMLQFLLIVPLVFLVSLLPLSFAGWGVRETGAVWLFGMIGFDKANALAISIAYGMFLLIAAAPGLILIYDARYKQ